MTDDGEFDARDEDDDALREQGGSLPAFDESAEESAVVVDQDAVALRVWAEPDGFPPGWDDQPLVELLRDRSAEDVQAPAAFVEPAETVALAIAPDAPVVLDPEAAVTTAAPAAESPITTLAAPIDAVSLTPTLINNVQTAYTPLDSEATCHIIQHPPAEPANAAVMNPPSSSFDDMVAVDAQAIIEPAVTTEAAATIEHDVTSAPDVALVESDEYLDINVDSLPEADGDLAAATMAAEVHSSFPVDEALDNDIEDAVDSDAHSYTSASTPEIEELLDAEADEIDPEPELVGAGPVAGGMWTIPMLCLGIAIIACCILIPQADYNRRLVYEREKLRRDADAITEQVKVNDEFLKKVADDASLAERLAQRQMKIVREGTRVLDLKSRGYEEAEMSPFQLTAVPPPEPLEPFQSRGGALTQACLNPHTRLYLIGGSLILMACGLVLGYAPRRR